MSLNEFYDYYWWQKHFYADSCGQFYPDIDALVCFICKEAGECLPGLFFIDENPNPEEGLEDIPTEILHSYLKHLMWSKGFYSPDSIPTTIIKKVEILTNEINERSKDS